MSDPSDVPRSDDRSSTNRVLLHDYLADSTAKKLVAIVGSATTRSEMTALIGEEIERRLADVEETLLGSDADVA